ncbi:MAG TPA: hypothetical protein VG369_06665 [Humibacter sp.]|jgi:hypothetical protein|nr:hypothetical protein [Humibacter sp.]
MSETPEDITKDALSSVAERVHDEANKAASAVAETGEKLDERHVEEGADRTSDAAESLRRSVASGVQTMADSAGDVRDQAAAVVKGHPTRVILIVAAAAAVLGFAIGVTSSQRR